jgi:methylated-DNA-[protein]-cysteine S-methyltransferase
MNECDYFHRKISSPFGTVGVAWRQGRSGRIPRIVRIFLPLEGHGMEARIGASCPGSRPGSHPLIDPVVDRIGRFLAGEAIDFSLDCLDLGLCGDFQRKVLRREFRIPRGRVMSYGGLAASLGHPQAARAVGTALARNPFPLIVPCHRTIQADGTLGGFGGGLKMKRALLEMEGVAFDRNGRIMGSFF